MSNTVTLKWVEWLKSELEKESILTLNVLIWLIYWSSKDVNIFILQLLCFCPSCFRFHIWFYFLLTFPIFLRSRCTAESCSLWPLFKPTETHTYMITSQLPTSLFFILCAFRWGEERRGEERSLLEKFSLRASKVREDRCALDDQCW